jgi:hypothetical protein
MWSLGKVVGTPEVMRVYVGSYWEEECQVRSLYLILLYTTIFDFIVERRIRNLNTCFKLKKQISLKISAHFLEMPPLAKLTRW